MGTMKLIEECLEMVDALDEHMDSFDALRREMAGHVILRLEEILGRLRVEMVSNEAILIVPDTNWTRTATRPTTSPPSARS